MLRLVWHVSGVLGDLSTERRNSFLDAILRHAWRVTPVPFLSLDAVWLGRRCSCLKSNGQGSTALK